MNIIEATKLLMIGKFIAIGSSNNKNLCHFSYKNGKIWLKINEMMPYEYLFTVEDVLRNDYELVL